MTIEEFVAAPVTRLYAVVAVLLVVKMSLVGTYTSVLRIRGNVYATPEDYSVRGLSPRGLADEGVERVRRAHLNDLENILPFLVVGFLYTLTRPSLLAAQIFFLGFLVARTLHSIFYVRSLQPHRTIAFGVGGVLTLGMLVSTLVAFAT